MHQQKQAKETTANKEEEPQNEQSKIPKRHMQKCTNHNIKVVKKKTQKKKIQCNKNAQHQANTFASTNEPSHTEWAPPETQEEQKSKPETTTTKNAPKTMALFCSLRRKKNSNNTGKNTDDNPSCPPTENTRTIRTRTRKTHLHDKTMQVRPCWHSQALAPRCQKISPGA